MTVAALQGRQKGRPKVSSVSSCPSAHPWSAPGFLHQEVLPALSFPAVLALAYPVPDAAIFLSSGFCSWVSHHWGLLWMRGLLCTPAWDGHPQVSPLLQGSARASVWPSTTPCRHVRSLDGVLWRWMTMSHGNALSRGLGAGSLIQTKEHLDLVLEMICPPFFQPHPYPICMAQANDAPAPGHYSTPIPRQAKATGRSHKLSHPHTQDKLWWAHGEVREGAVSEYGLL